MEPKLTPPLVALPEIGSVIVALIALATYSMLTLIGWPNYCD